MEKQRKPEGQEGYVTLRLVLCFFLSVLFSMVLASLVPEDRLFLRGAVLCFSFVVIGIFLLFLFFPVSAPRAGKKLLVPFVLPFVSFVTALLFELIFREPTFWSNLLFPILVVLLSCVVFYWLEKKGILNE